MLALTVDGLRIVTVYAPNGRVVGSPFYAGKLAWFERLRGWMASENGRAWRLPGPGWRFQRRPADIDVWDPAAAHGGTHVCEPERAAFRTLLDDGLTDAYRARHDEPGRYTWWDYRAGMFHKNFGMRIDHLLVGAAVAPRVVDAEIDREARKGPPVPVRPRPAGHRSRRGRASRSTRTGPAPSLGSRGAPGNDVADTGTRRAGSPAATVGSPSDDGPQRRRAGDPRRSASSTWRSASARSGPSTACRSRSDAASSSRCSAHRAAARPRPCG